MISPETIDAIRSRMDIAELVREHVPGLKKAGRNWAARCPFHQERTPSFTVSPERQTFHCWGCHEHGDVFAFLMKIEGLSFYEAVERLAERTGVAIAKRSESMSPADRERLRIREALQFARDFYHGLLLNSGEAAAARAYLAKRGVSAASIENFGLGFAPRRSDTLLAEAQLKGFGSDLLVAAGLAKVQEGRGLRDFFFGRLLFPISDTKGQVTAFGGRALDDSMPKYLNSPETAVFSKSRTLFALFQALPAVRKSRRVLLVEGYMDAIACHQFGVVEAVAPLGTALTVEHATALARYATHATVVFDADNAGLAAAVRGAETLLHAGLEVRIATVPEGKDPDELLQRSGVEPFQRCLAEACDLVEFRTTLAMRGRKAELAPAEKASVARDILGTIAQCPDEVLKAEWVRRLSQRLRVDEGALLRQLGKEPAGGAVRSPRAAGTRPSPRPEGGAGGMGLPPADRQILALVMRQPGLAASVQETDWTSAAAARIWRALSGLDVSDAAWPQRLMAALPPEDRILASALLVGESPSRDPEADLSAILGRLRREKRLREIEPLMKGDAPVDGAIMDEYRKLLTELKGSRK
ncbi:MAG: DNA primase [Elusimicrobia bacterium]|nr:DNA primase [Elusimicrobiota bacterium]